ncbi:50S ribosomal protein HLP, mitochondrial-like [Phoenix dactylifera]|uniref:50S ribosomal protein L14, chloroplastic n=1 Tax=Phoenix dactylifera TaxID=42345 RepID=A0A8B8Z915_PHODC|nr:50S ribosomal protein HLP, mitochondrial-like [Phoenix dactylifera]
MDKPLSFCSGRAWSWTSNSSGSLWRFGLGTPLQCRPGWREQQQRTFIQMRTNLKVVDNSGAKWVMCVQALKGRRGVRLGDTIIASIKEAQPRGKVKKGEVVYGVVVHAAMHRGCCDGSEIKFDDNAVVLVNKQGEPIGTRVFGPVSHELRKKKHVKILTLAEHIA